MMLSASLAWPVNEPLLIGRPDPMFLGGLECALLVLGIEAADGGCWRRFEAVDFPGRRVLAAGFFGLRISPSTQCNSRRAPRGWSERDGPNRLGRTRQAASLEDSFLWHQPRYDRLSHTDDRSRRAQIMMVPRRAMMRSHS